MQTLQLPDYQVMFIRKIIKTCIKAQQSVIVKLQDVEDFDNERLALDAIDYLNFILKNLPEIEDEEKKKYLDSLNI